MSVDDVVRGVQIIVGIFAGIALVVNAQSFWKSRKTEQIRLSESILKDIRDSEDQIDKLIKDNASKEDKQEWGRRFFNTVEWLSFLINNKHITEQTLIDFYKPSFKMWHEEWFNHDYLEKDYRDNKKNYEEFRKLYDYFRMDENWKDCKCSDCKI
jgi:hypothetical protein